MKAGNAAEEPQFSAPRPVQLLRRARLPPRSRSNGARTWRLGRRCGRMRSETVVGFCGGRAIAMPYRWTSGRRGGIVSGS